VLTFHVGSISSIASLLSEGLSRKLTRAGRSHLISEKTITGHIAYTIYARYDTPESASRVDANVGVNLQAIICQADGQIEEQQFRNDSRASIDGSGDLRKCRDANILFDLYDERKANQN
jgi:hypothetical protein